MLEFVKTGAENGTLVYVARADGREIGRSTLRLAGSRIAMTVEAEAYEDFVFASAVNAAAMFGLTVEAGDDERLTKYGFSRAGGRMTATPEEIKFPHECGGSQ